MNQRLRKWSGLLWIWLALLCISPAMVPKALAQTAPTFKQGIQQGILKVKFKESQTSSLSRMRMSVQGNGIVQTGIKGMDRMAVQYGVKQMRRLFPYNAKDEALLRKHGLHLWYEVEFSSQVDVKQAIQAYAQLGEVAIAEPHYQKKHGGSIPKAYTGSSKAKAQASETLPMNDPLLKDQWHYHNPGTLAGSLKGADINLFGAWTLNTGKPEVIVSVHDEGVDVKHEDLAANMWVNQAEKNGTTGVDDDGNGYVDDVNGYSFANREGAIPAQSHGTHVSGTIAAVNNNGKGVSGVAGGSGKGDGARIMACQILSGRFSNIADSYRYAAMNGAVISQNSWGYIYPNYIEQSVKDGIDFFIAEAGNYPGSLMKGGVVIFAAGNDGSDDKWYPGYYENTISVASLGPNNKAASYSNFGKWVELSAPGGDQRLSGRHGVLSTMPGNRYGYMQGTSMACPHVSGIAALVVSQLGGADFTAEKLKRYLFNACRNVDSYNPGLEGMLGLGLIDSHQAMLKDEGKAPGTINDLSVVLTGQDMARLLWTVPSDEDDSRPLAFTVVYGTEPITADNWKSMSQVKIPNSLQAGEPMQYELKGLKSLTNYYVAVVAVDRWENYSALSNTIAAKTTEGPTFALGSTSLQLLVDTREGFTGTQPFQLLNQGKGLLQWKTEIRQNSVQWDTYSQTTPKLPVRTEIPKVRTRAGGKPYVKAPEQTAAPAAQYEHRTYTHAGYSHTMIGEDNADYPMSLATRFRIYDREGFNLTHVSQTLDVDPASGDIIVEIRKGDALEDSKVMTSLKVTPYTYYEYEYTFELPEHLFFAQWETFWVVIHTPAGNEYPLGLGDLINMREDVGHAKMSFDMGQQWHTLYDLMNTEQLTWSTRAHSRAPYIGQVLTLLPDQGEVSGEQSMELQLQAQVQDLLNGNYGANLIFSTNDKEQPEVRLPIDLRVEGQQPQLNSAPIVDFSSVFVGNTKRIYVELENTGLGNFTIQESSCDRSDFRIAEKPYNILAKDKAIVAIEYAPTKEGPLSSLVHFKDSQGNSHQFTVFGVGMEPAKIAMEPSSLSVDMEVNGTAQASVTLENKGKYPLQYYFPKFASQPKGLGKPSNEFGYSAQRTDYAWESIAGKGQEITSELDNAMDRYVPIELGFNFPLFGKSVDKLYATVYGVLTPDNTKEDMLERFPVGLGQYNTPDGLLSAAYIPINFSKGGHVFYLKENGKLTVEYQDVHSQLAYEPMSFQIQLFANGDVRYVYKKLGMDSYSFNGYSFIGIEATDKSDGMKLSGWGQEWLITGDEQALLLRYPGPEIVKQISEPSGTLQIGESKTLTLSLDATGLTSETHKQYLEVVSNDAVTPYEVLSIQANINGGQAELHTLADTLDLGTLPVGERVEKTLVLANKGSKKASITAVEGDLGSFVLESTLPMDIQGKQAGYISFSLQGKQAGKQQAQLNVTDAEGNTYPLTLMAEVVAAPLIAVDKTPLSFSLNSGEQAQDTVLIDNSQGKNTLEVVPVGNPWLETSELTAGMTNAFPALKEFTYHVQDNKQPGTVEYAWDDIVGTGEQHVIDFREGEYATQVELPFSFPFYGKQYEKMYISLAGVISFDKPQEDPEFDNTVIPQSGDGFNNFIAPFWGILFPSFFSSLDKHGIFYKTYEDRVVVSFERMSSIYAPYSSPISAQAILYKNGHIKFQYRFEGWGSEQWAWIQSVGVENADGTEGVEVARHRHYLSDKLAIELTPARKLTIPAGETRQLLLTANANGMSQGEYNGSLLLRNNTPGQREVRIPATLTVSGEADLTLPDSLDMGSLMAYESYPGEPQRYRKDFYLENTGSAPITLQTATLAQSHKDMQLYEKLEASWGSYWNKIESPYLYTTLEPSKRKYMRLEMLPTQEGLQQDTLVVESDLGTHRMPIKASVYLPPVLSVSDKQLKAIAYTESMDTVQQVWVDNTAGKSPLNYQLQMEYLTAAPMAKEGYNQLLEYGQDTIPDSFLGFRGSEQFVAATGFTAPEKGFKLSHVGLHHRNTDSDSSQIQVQVLLGNRINTARVVGEQTFWSYLKDDKDPDSGHYKTVQLHQPVDILPGQRFFVVLTYALSERYPAAYVNREFPLEETFFAQVDGEWVDLAYTPFGEASFMVKAMEKNALETIWATIDGPTEGSVPAGERKQVDIRFKARPGQDADQYARMHVSSNDPYTSNTMVDIQLHRNQGPAFAQSQETQAMSEGDSLVWTWVAKDPEGDSFTYQVEGLPAFAAFQTAGDTAIVTAKPSFEQAGKYTFSLAATDSYGVRNKLAVNVNVANVNRAPIQQPLEMLTLSMSERKELTVKELFTDADGDELQLQITSAADAVAGAMQAGDKLVIVPVGLGQTAISVKATDGKGGETTASIAVTILKDNHAPVAKTMGNMLMEMGDNAASISLAELFADQDGDVLSIEHSSTQAGVASFEIKDGKLSVMPAAVGKTSVSLKATDTRGASASLTFSVEVLTKNFAPVAKQVAPVNCWTGQKFLPFNLEELFSDQNQDVLSFQVQSANAQIAAAVLSGSELRVLPMTLGSTDILLTATDPRGASATITIRVNVVDPVVLGIEQLQEGSVKLFPNPATGQQPVLLAYQLSKPAQVRIELRSVQGQLLSTQEAQQGPEAQQVQIDVKTLPAGVYIVSLFVDGKPAKTLRLVKQ